MMQQLAPSPAAAPMAPMAMPDVGRGENGLLLQFINIYAPTFSGPEDEDPRMFLRELEKQFRLMAYKGPRRVEMAEFILRGPA